IPGGGGSALAVIDVSDPENPVMVDNSISLPGGGWTVKYHDNHIFIGFHYNGGGEDDPATSSNDTFRIVDVSDPENPVLVFDGTGFDYFNPHRLGFWRIDIKGDYLYGAV